MLLLLLLLSRFSRVRLCETPYTEAHEAPRPWDSPGKNTGVGCHFLLQLICYTLFFYFLFLTLQYCIGFAIYQNESATGIHVFPILNPPPSPYHPSGSSRCTSPKHPVSCIEPGLVTRFIYDIIHVSMPFSQIIPSSPSPTESKRLFCTSVSLLLSIQIEISQKEKQQYSILMHIYGI